MIQMDSAKRAKIESLLRKLIASTADGAIPWQETVSEDRFYALMKEGAFEVERREYQENELAEVQDGYLLNVLNRSGRVVETISPQEDPDGLLQRLFQAARSRARNGDQLLDNLLNEISV